MRSSVADRFWAKVDKSGGSDACWEWTGCRSKGYGELSVMGHGAAPWKAHRISYILATGQQIPDGVEVMHECDNPACVNPAHLKLGTHAENMAEMSRRNRAHGSLPLLRGSKNGGAKLTDEQVAEMRARVLRTGESARVIAKDYHIHSTMASRILRNEAWVDPTYDARKYAAKRGSNTPPHHAGEDHPSSKLTWDDARAIRSLASEKSQRWLAEHFGVSKACINNVLHGRTWREETCISSV